MELINLKRGTNLIQKFSEKMQKFYLYLSKNKFPQLRSLGLRMVALFVSVYVCQQLFSLIKNNKTINSSRLTDGHTKSVMKVVSSNISPRIQILSHLRTMPSLQPAYTIVMLIKGKVVPVP
jgi:predicted DNA-binding transcriptional regulator AlpA